MRWGDERYVRVYTRNTGDWNSLGWEAQALLVLALRQCDRAGILDVGRKQIPGLASLVHMPEDVVSRALPRLLEDGCIVESGTKLVFKNFIEAQESPQTDAQRAREKRARDRDKAAGMSQNVTEESRNVTESSRPATAGNDEQRTVTPFRAVPSVPIHTEEEPCARARSNAGAKSAHDWLCCFNAKFFSEKGKQRGTSSDAVASARLADMLTQHSDEERAEDWGNRDRIIMEFLGRSDRATVDAGWKFAFFVASFDGLRISPAMRPKTDKFGNAEPERTVTRSRYR